VTVIVGVGSPSMVVTVKLLSAFTTNSASVALVNTGRTGAATTVEAAAVHSAAASVASTVVLSPLQLPPSKGTVTVAVLVTVGPLAVEAVVATIV
jgi:hypothetical protein